VWLTTLFFFGAFSTGVRGRCTTGGGAGDVAAAILRWGLQQRQGDSLATSASWWRR
jgi:hypothetical protein